MADILLFAFIDFFNGRKQPLDPANKNLSRLVRAHESATKRRRLGGLPFFRRFRGSSFAPHENGDVFNKTQGPEMRRLIALLFLIIATPAFAADPPAAPAVKGLWLLTDYPSQTVRPGEVANVRFKLQNAGLAPESLALSVERRAGRAGRPTSWAAASRSPRRCRASTRARSLQLRVDVPKDAKPGSQTLTINAKGGTQSISLPVTLTIGAEAPAKLTIKSKPAVADGHAEVVLRVHDLGQQRFGQGPDRRAVGPGAEQLRHQLHRGLRLQRDQLDSDRGRPVQGHQDQGDAAARREGRHYPVLVKVAAEGATAEQRVTLQISGQGRLSLSAKDGRLSGEATAGKTSDYTLVVSNDGTAPLEDVEISGSRADQLEGRVQPEEHPERGAQREEGGAGRR